MPSARETLSGSIVPVVVVDDAATAPELVSALADGGIDTVELTLRTAAGLDAIRAVAGSGSLIGAGTVLTVRQVDEVADAPDQLEPAMTRFGQRRHLVGDECLDRGLGILVRGEHRDEQPIVWLRHVRVGWSRGGLGRRGLRR